MDRPHELVGMIDPTDREADTLTPERAVAWLGEWAQDYAFLLERGFALAETDESRGAFGMLAVELGYVLDACAAAIGGGKPVALRVTTDAEWRISQARNIARILATPIPEFPDVLAELAGRLAITLAAAEAEMKGAA